MPSASQSAARRWHRTERRVAERLLDLGPEATLLSAAALAEQLGTSDATIVAHRSVARIQRPCGAPRALAAYDKPATRRASAPHARADVRGRASSPPRFATTFRRSRPSPATCLPRPSKKRSGSSPGRDRVSGEASVRPHTLPLTGNSLRSGLESPAARSYTPAHHSPTSS